jgi:hypothetical protein
LRVKGVRAGCKDADARRIEAGGYCRHGEFSS